MKIEQQVCSLEFARKMKDLGVKQDSYAYWWEGGWKDEWCVVPADVFTCDCDSEPEAMHGCDIRKIAAERIGGPGKYDPEAAFSAFTVAELGEMLPHFLNERNVFVGQLIIWKNPNNEHVVIYGTMHHIYHREAADTEADARAKMLIYLLENKFITV